VTEFLISKYKNEPVFLSARLEAEISMLEEDQTKRQELYQQYGLSESGLNSLIVRLFTVSLAFGVELTN